MKLANKTLLTIALAVALAACGKKDEAAPTTAPASTTPAAAPAAAPASTPTPPPADTAPTTAAPTPVAASVAAGALPEACEAYLKRAAACYEKAAAANGAAVEQMKQGLEQVRTQWNAVPDKSQLGSACAMANDQFAQTVSMLKCE